MSVSRSLTGISGSRPVRSASATANTATFWKARSASTWRSGSSAASRSGPRGEFARKSGARGDFIECLGIDQLVEQQREIADLARQESADRANVDQTVQSRGLLDEKREVGIAGADGIQHPQHPLHHRGRGRLPCGRLQYAVQDEVHAPAARLIEPAVGSRMAIGFQLGRDRRNVGGGKSAAGQFLRDVGAFGGKPAERALAVAPLRVGAAEHQRFELAGDGLPRGLDAFNG